MTLKYIDKPTSISGAGYVNLKERIVNQLLDDNSVLSVYQMGSIRHPGISDLDIICVFKNKSKCIKNYRSNLNFDEKNILTHGIFGIEEYDLIESISFNFLSNLKHLGGRDLNINNVQIVTSDDLKKQIALEYLIKMLMTIEAQVTMGIVKLRAFLLLAKAIEFDLKLLEIENGKLYDLVQQVIYFRDVWFNKRPNDDEITNLVLNFNKELKDFLGTELLKNKFYLPNVKFNLPGNFIIQKSNEFSITHKGLVLPNQLSFIGRKYINLQNRLNSFSFNIPFDIPDINSIHNKRFQFCEKTVLKNSKLYPYFLPLTTSLSIY